MEVSLEDAKVKLEQLEHVSETKEAELQENSAYKYVGEVVPLTLTGSSWSST